ncbi:MAG: sugar nucleotide-binding protein, partial [Pirellulales bacterium]|nr:sugar nucleotide-binding protein [Pirellulales bacterium]
QTPFSTLADESPVTAIDNRHLPHLNTSRVMILLLGATGYIGSAFERFFRAGGIPFQGVSRREVDYTDRETLSKLIDSVSPSFLINAAGYTGKPNVDACERDKAECLAGNAVLPGRIRAACEQIGLPWGHVSSGCIYSGTRPDGLGFTEEDPPNFCFRTNHCSFYSGSKALGEECLYDAPQTYIWRVRIPFNHEASPRNYLTKLQHYDTLLEATNSISHLDEFVRAAWQCWDRRVEPGIYNITNPGTVKTSEVAEMIRDILLPGKQFKFFADEAQFMQLAAKTPRSNCVLDSSKLQAAGIPLTPVIEAIQNALQQWQEVAQSVSRG